MLELVDVLLALGLTLRLNRIVTGDHVGLWFFRGPASQWAWSHEKPPIGTTWVPGWRSKLQLGLSCPFCVGFWIAIAVTASLWLAGGPGDAWTPWRWVAGAFTLNYIAAHLGGRLGDVDTEDEDE